MELENLLKREKYRAIIKFFHENPACIDTPRGIATWTGLDAKSVDVALRKLSSLGFLVSHKASSTTGYSYTRDKKTIGRIEKLLRKDK